MLTNGATDKFSGIQKNSPTEALAVGALELGGWPQHGLRGFASYNGEQPNKVLVN
jgi:hypothetical protein